MAFTPPEAQDAFTPPEAQAFVPPEVKQGPSLGQIGAGLTAEIVVAEGTKMATTAAGAAIGTVILPGLGTAIGAGAGYILGALGGGAAGSILAQNIEGREELNEGRIVADSLINFIPFSKAAKGGKFVTRAGQAVLKQGAAGAVIAPGARVVEAAVDGEDVTAQELLIISAMGATLGAGLGVTGEAGTKIYKKFAKATPEEIEKAIYSGDKDALLLLNKSMQNVDVPDGTATQEVSKLAKLKARLFPSSATGAEVMSIAKEAKDRIARGSQASRIATKQLDKIKKSLPMDSQDAFEEGINQFILKNDDSMLRNSGLRKKELDKALDFGAELRDEIGMLQNKLINGHYNKSRELPDYLVEKIERQIRDRDYMSRRYKLFDEQGYVPSKQQTEDAIAEVMGSGRIVTDNQQWKKVKTKNGKEIKVKNPNYGKEVNRQLDRTEAEAYLQSLVDKRKDPDAVHVLLVGGNTPTGVLKRRKNLDDMPALRSFLGEETSAIKRAQSTIDSLSRITAYDEADLRIKDTLDRLGLLSKGGVSPNTRQLKLKSGIVREGDEALRVPTDVAIALDQFYNVGNLDASTNPVANSMRNLFKTGVALSKASKVLANPPSYMVNVFGMLSSLVGMGMNPFRGSVAGIKAGLRNFDAIAGASSRSAREHHKRLIELDIVPPGATVADINNGLEGALGNLVQKGLDVPGKLYSLADTAGRVVAYENHRVMFRKAMPDLPREQLEELAALHTNRVYQNYNYVPQTLKELNRYGVLGQFAAFSQELIRNQYNQGKIIKDMISGKLARELTQQYGQEASASVLRKEGIKRAAALTAMYGGVAAAIHQFNRQTVNEEEEAAYRRSEATPWNKDRSLVMWKVGDKINVINSSYLIPHMQLFGAVQAGINEENFGDAMLGAASSIWADLGGEGDFIYNALVPAVQNKRLGSDKPISEKAGGVGEKLDQVGFFFETAFRPGFMREIERATDIERGQTPKTTALRQLGIRIDQNEIGDGSGFKIGEAKAKMQLSKSEFNKEKVKFGRTENYDNHNKNFRENFEIISNAAQDLKTLGLTEDKIIERLRRSGLSTLDALNAIDGNVMDMPRASTNPAQDAWEKVEELPKDQQLRAIRSESNRDIRDSMLRRYKTSRQLGARGYSAREIAIRGLDTNGRFRYIRSQPNPKAAEAQIRRLGLMNDRLTRMLRDNK